MNLKKFTLILCSFFIVLLTACPSDDKKETPKETAVKNLVKAWKVNVTGTSATIGPVDNYKDIILTFNNNGTYSLTGADDVYPANKPAPSASGNWVINDAANEITFDGSKKVSVSTISATNLIFSFTGKEAVKFTTDTTIEYNMIP